MSVYVHFASNKNSNFEFPYDSSLVGEISRRLSIYWAMPGCYYNKKDTKTYNIMARQILITGVLKS